MNQAHPICDLVGIRQPCLGSISVLAGIDKPCGVCGPKLTEIRSLFGWHQVEGTEFHFSHFLPPEQQAKLRLVFDFWTAQMGPLKAELGVVLELVRSAKATLSVEDYGDALTGAERRLEALLQAGRQRAEGEGERSQGA